MRQNEDDYDKRMKATDERVCGVGGAYSFSASGGFSKNYPPGSFPKRSRTTAGISDGVED